MSLKSSSCAVDLCSQGLISGQVEPTLESIGTQLLGSVQDKQIQLSDQVAKENQKYAKSEEEFQLEAILDRTRKYHLKLSGLEKQMWILTQRSQAMKLRSATVQEAKQKEALRREHQRQLEQERDDALVAQPPSK